MFLERKFSRVLSPGGPADPPLCPLLSGEDWSKLPDLVRDVLVNLQLLLGARRGYSHVLADFGLSASNGQHGLEARVERLQEELPPLLQRYERRLRLADLEVEVDAAGVSCMKVSGDLLPGPGQLVFHFGIVSLQIRSIDYFPSPSV